MKYSFYFILSYRRSTIRVIYIFGRTIGRVVAENNEHDFDRSKALQMREKFEVTLPCLLLKYLFDIR